MTRTGFSFPRPLHHGSRRPRPWALVAMSSALLAVFAAPAGAQTFVQPGGTDATNAPALASGCSNVHNQYPSGSKGYGIATLDYISKGSLTDGATTVTGINAALCSVFQAPQDPQLTLPADLFTNQATNAPLDPSKPQTAAVFTANEVSYAPANITLSALAGVSALLSTLPGLSGVGQLILTPVALPSSVPCVQELAAAGIPAPSTCSIVEQPPVPAGAPGAGGFNLDIVTGAINTIDIPSAAAPVVSCVLAPAVIPLTTNSAFFSKGSANAASPIVGPLSHALATVVSTPQFALPHVQTCTVLNTSLPLIGSTVAQVIDTLLHASPATFTAPLLLQLSLTQGPSGS